MQWEYDKINGYLNVLDLFFNFPLIPVIENDTSQWVSLDNTSYIPLSSATIPVGCRYPKLQWCTTISKMELYQYVMGMVLLAVGYPVSSVLCYSLFSKILGPHPQVCALYHVIMHIFIS